MVNIRYMHEKDLGIELIICQSSSISYPIHNHISVFTFGLVLDGAIDLAAGETTTCYCSNGIFFIPPYVPHKITAYGKYTLLTCCINKNTIAAMPLDVLIKIIASLLKKTVICNDISNKQTALIIESLCLSQGVCAKTNILEAHLQEIISQLELYPERQIHICDMAQAAFVSKYYFIRKFKEKIGLTPHQFLIQNRVRKAQHLLSEYDTITEVALTAGFCDQSHFIRNFEKIVGLTPTAYKMAYTPISLLDEIQINAGKNLANI